MWLRGPIRDGAVQIGRLVSFEKGVKATFAEPWADVWYVDGENGNDRNSGRGQNKAKKLISVAEVAAKDNDVVYLKNGDHTMPAKLTWDLNDARLIGTSLIPMQPHLDLWQKAATTFSPMIEVSGRGNIFANMTLRHGSEYTPGVGYNTDLICMLVSGRYNYFENVYFYSPLYGEQDVAATYKGVKITGHNNYFRGCKFGSDGLNRDQANWNLSIEGGIGNIFEDCIFQMGADGIAPFFVRAYSSIDMKYTWFKNCTFVAYSSSYGTTPSYAFDIDVLNSLGIVIDARCTFVNVGQISDTNGDGWIWKPVLDRGATEATAETIKETLIARRNQGA
ncbi:MAG: hypothetical protein KAV87_12390 [Desulfobacteraceae bacterium]|nr:hypothetical protein [Desulfobacteraceae bacterium]